MLMLVSAGCAYTTVSNPNPLKIVSGTKVPFSKVMNAGFAKDYVDSDIVTEANFLASGSGAYSLSAPQGYVVFQAVPLGTNGQVNPLTQQAMGDFVFVPNSYADMVFELKPGDKVQLRGGTKVRTSNPILKMIGADVTEIQFIANSMKKLR